MTALTFQQTLAENVENLTTAQKQLASYILDNAETAAFLTARQLADAAGQSDAAVVRLAKALGYDGFPNLRAALRDGLLERAGASGMGPRQPPSDMDELKTELFEIDSLLARNTSQLNSTELGNVVAKKLIGARRIWVSGHGTTHPMASYLTLHLNQVTGKAALLNIGNGDISDQLRLIHKDDVVIGIGYIRYLPYTVDIMRVAKSRGAHIVAITDRPSSPLAALSHQSFFVARDTSSFAWWSQAGTMALINWLIVLITIHDAENVAQLLRGSDEVWRTLGHWQSEGNSVSDQTLEGHLKAGIENRGSQHNLSSTASSPKAGRPTKGKQDGKNGQRKAGSKSGTK
ncbi:MurR/RpiR family transcriptional regulator [Herbaspirillum sp. alder98]|uniref:MurR/RpiR family transcriptional regulator n=1 Tax=Herbaspirillum sp. alder98 TaxID=2913096 RepID=UPI001CD8F8C7|nr:MurR/RpiR family transcriptional regulator [Herbaspirillum sp. alder98]MCA1326408.1 MurR/RpiR family transcriptional regulator [Herbaspirillum sp. alder98]